MPSPTVAGDADFVPGEVLFDEATSTYFRVGDGGEFVPLTAEEARAQGLTDGAEASSAAPAVGVAAVAAPPDDTLVEEWDV